MDDRWFLFLSALLRYLGTISYGIYLWHTLVIVAIKPLFLGQPEKGCLWSLSLTILFASLSWHFFEKPVRVFYGRASANS